LRHKASGQEWTSADRGTLGLIIWNYEGGAEIDRSAFACEVLDKRPERVRVRLRGVGKTGLFRSIELGKTVTLFANQSRVRVDHEVKLDANLMTGRDIGLQFHNFIGMPRQTCAYCFPTDKGVERVEAEAEVWRYNPARGWVAAVGPRGDGLLCEMGYKRLMCFYQWPIRGGVSTLEWMFRRISIPNGGSFQTTCWLMPFAGLPLISAAQGGIVCSLTAAEPSPRAHAGKRVTIKLTLVSSEDREVSATVTGQRLPGTETVVIGKSQLKLKATELLTLSSRSRRSTKAHVIAAAIKSGDALLAEAEEPVVVGKESGEYALKLKEQRPGNPQERFGRKPLYGTGPRDIVLTDEILTPHVKWAKPYHKGRIKALVPVSYPVGREVIELAQRLDMDFATVSFENSASAMHYVPGFFHARGGDQVWVAPRENLREQLEKDYDCLIVGGLKWDRFTDEAINATIAEKATKGMGIVWIQPDSLPDNLWQLLPLRQRGERVWTSRNLDARWEKAESHFLTEGVPFEVLPATRFSTYQAEVAPLATIVDSAGKPHPLLAAWESPLRGRAVALTYNLPRQGAGSCMCGLTPWAVSTGVKFPYWEYYYSLLCKCALWADRRKPEIVIESIAAEKPVYDEADHQVAGIVLALQNPWEADRGRNRRDGLGSARPQANTIQP